MSGAEQPTASGSRAGRPSKRSRAEIARTSVFVVLAILITLFAVLNVKSVEVNWIFGSSEAPLIIVIVISFLIGVALTYLVQRRTRKR